MGELGELQSGDPRWIGPYRLEGRLASGGMGHVYLGWSPGGRQVAIKVIRPELAEDPDFRARFAREVAAARKVSGIFTAAVVDADPDAPLPWLATSYVAGPSLADAVADRGPLPAASVLRLAAGLAEGLVAIHSAGVVHRDLTPSNVLLAEDGPRLIDFGISRSVAASTLTRTGMVVGSPGFMSPEQAQGREAGPPSDIFSLGTVLAFAATGNGPFGGGSSEALLYRVVTGKPDTDELPDEIRPVIERCLAKDPRRRPTAAQLLAELSAAKPRAVTPMAHPVTERTVTAPELHPVTSVEPHPVIVPEPHPVADGRVPRAERHRPSRRGWLMAVAAAAVLAAAGTGVFLAGRTGHVTNRTSPPPPSSQQAGSPTLMATLDTYLTRSALVRPTVQTAIDGVRSCSQSAPSGEAALQQAINTRQDILNRLQALSPSGLPGGTQLISTLSAAMQNSIEADKDYQNWMAEFARSGSACGSDPSQDPDFLAGQNASGRAATAKKAFVNIWNPMALRYGKKTYASTDF